MDRWEPDAEQLERMTWLGAWLRRTLPREFRFAEHVRERYEPPPSRKALTEPPLDGYLAATLDELARAHPADFLASACAELFCFPLASPLRPAERDCSGPTWAFKSIGDLVSQAWLERHPTPYSIDLLAGRARFILSHPFEGAELPQAAFGDHPTRGYLSPSLQEVLESLAMLREHPCALEPIRQIVTGAWDLPVALPEEWARRHALKGQPTSYRLFGSQVTPSLEKFLDALHRRQLFSYAHALPLVRRLPHALPGYFLEAHYDEETGFRAVLRDWTRQLVWDTCASLHEENLVILDAFWNWKLYGARWLFRACEHVAAASGLQPTGAHYGGPERAVRWLAEIHGLVPEDRPDEVVERLRRFGSAVLETVLPFSRAARPLVLRALGWEAAEPLLLVVQKIATRPDGQESDIVNSADPTMGVVDRQEIADCLSAAGPLAARLIGRLRDAQVGPGNALTLVEAVAGSNRAAILKSLDKDAQTPIKAYGLLPLERGTDEVVERYLRLKQIHREARKFGLERQANTRAAVQVALANLAQTAGFSDATRLEWGMEARVTESALRPGRRVAVQAWDLELLSSGPDMSVAVTKAGKRLASVPAAVRKSEAYAEMQDAVEGWRAQRQRLRRTFEAMMVDGDGLDAENLDALRRLPAAGALLDRLVLRDEAGLGIPDPDLRTLRSARGDVRPILPPLSVAHPQDLEAAAELEAWQRAVVRERMVQPFKQVFRELYVLTPVERRTGTFSERFAGRAIDARVAARLLQSREWQTVADETRVLPFKPLRQAGLLALFELEGARYYLGADPVVTTGRIRFARRTPAWQWRREGDIPLAEVPSRAFSEVLRDADLVSSVASKDDHPPWSPEAARLRADFVKALVAEMALPGVAVEDDFVSVRGRIARYRVHVGSAEVRVDPGDHACILPKASVPAGDIYLPFADEDARCEDVVRKVLLLASDHQIADETVLARIRAAIARPS